MRNLFKTLPALMLSLVCAPYAISTELQKSSATWDEWVLPTSDGCRLYIKEVGQGRPIIVLHGGPGADHSALVSGFLPLSGQYKFVFYDQRGSLRSPCKVDSPVSVDAHVSDLEELRKQFGLSEVELIAHSAGGYLAMAYADKYPLRVKRLALVDAIPARSSKSELADLQTQVMQRIERAEVLTVLVGNGLTTSQPPPEQPRQRSLWGRIVFGAVNLRDVGKWALLEGKFFFQQAASEATVQSQPESWDFISRLSSLPIQILVIAGEDDFLPIAMQEAWVRDVPNARIVKVTNAGHVPWIDQPRVFLREIKGYLEP